MRRPTRDPYARPAIQTLERLHDELGGKILENKQEHANLNVVLPEPDQKSVRIVSVAC